MIQTITYMATSPMIHILEGKKTCIIVQALKVKKGGRTSSNSFQALCLSQHIQISDFFQQRNWEKFGKIMCKFF